MCFPPIQSRNKRHRYEAEQLPAGHVMLEAIDKYAGGVFNPDDVRILVAAFDDAWRSPPTEVVRLEVLARAPSGGQWEMGRA